MEQNPDKAPFKDWAPSDFKGWQAELFTLPGHEDLVVRRSVKLNVLPDGRKVSIAEGIKDWSMRAEKMKGFCDKYGIRMAKTSYFVGNNPRFHPKLSREEEKAVGVSEESPALMAVTERIDGKNLMQFREFDEKMKEEIDAMFSGLFTNLFETYTHDNEGYFWYDYGNGQIVYGVAPGEKEKHLYVVDVDPSMENWIDVATRKEDKERTFWRELESIFHRMRDMEPKTQSGKLERSRAVLQKILSELPELPDSFLARLRKSMAGEGKPNGNYTYKTI